MNKKINAIHWQKKLIKNSIKTKQIFGFTLSMKPWKKGKNSKDLK